MFLPVLIATAQNNVLTHIVKPGENITQIAGLYKVKAKDIYSLNNITNNTIIKAGQKLLIPMGGFAEKTVKSEIKTQTISQTKSIPYHIIFIVLGLLCSLFLLFERIFLRVFYFFFTLFFFFLLYHFFFC